MNGSSLFGSFLLHREGVNLLVSSSVHGRPRLRALALFLVAGAAANYLDDSIALGSQRHILGAADTAVEGLGIRVDFLGVTIGGALPVRQGCSRREGAHLIVLVRGSGGHLQAFGVGRNRQRVGVLALVEGTIQSASAELDVLDRGVIVVPATTKVFAKAIAGIHDANQVAIHQAAIGNGVATKALIGEPVVQRAHPTRLLAAVRCTETIDFADVIAFSALLSVIVVVQRGNHGTHHGGIAVDVYPIVDQLALPGSGLISEGSVLDDDLHLACRSRRLRLRIVCKSNRRAQAKSQHYRKCRRKHTLG